MTPRALAGAVRATRRSVGLLALGWVVLLLVAFAWRLAFPLELEWMEGGMLHQARRLQLGLSPYPPPGPDYVPFLYTPLYSMVLAGLGAVLPLGYPLGRAVSILAAVATGLALWQGVRGEGKPRAHAAAAVGLMSAGYVFTFRWFDVARPDMLYIALTTWGLVLLRHCGRRASRAVVAGVLIALAFWTKQTAASFVLASGVGVLLVDWRRLPLYAGTIALIDGGGVLLFDALTDGWLWTYIYELHQSHAFNRERFTTKTWGMFLHAWPMVTLVVLGLVAGGLGRLPARVRRWGTAPESPRRSAADEPVAPVAPDPARGGRALAYWTLMAATALLVSALGYATQWAEPNAFIPGVVLGALALGVALPQRGWGEPLALGAIAVQLVVSLVVEPRYHPVQRRGWAGLRDSYTWHDPWRTLPRPQAWRDARVLRAELEAGTGEVLALHRPWWSVLAGGDGHVGTMGMTDVQPDQRAAIRSAIVAAVREERYARIFVEGEPPRWLAGALRRRYRVQRRRHGPQRVRPLSGYMSEAGMVTPYRRDQLLLVPRDDRVAPSGTTVVIDFESGTLEELSVEGRAFARPQRGPPRSLPMAGPYGGEFLLFSGGPRAALTLTGVALTPSLVLPARGRIEMLAGYAGPRAQGLSVRIEGDDGRIIPLAIPGAPHALSVVRWNIPPDWAGAQIRVRLGDETPEAALYFDDLWVVDESSEPRR